MQSDQQPFGPLGAEALAAFARLGSPLYIFSFATQRVCWANARALEFWNAASPEELYARDLGPFSPATKTRLADYHQAFAACGQRTESWTFYPHGKAITALCRCTGVSLSGHGEAMLVEVQTLKPVELPISELRQIEVLRHTPLMISLFSAEGEVLVRNPAALAKFGELDRALPPGSDHFRAMFAQAAECERLLADAGRTGTGHGSATIAVRRWPVHSVQVSHVTDPATGLAALLVAQQDISPLVTVSRQLVASEEALGAVLNLNVAPVLILPAHGTAVLAANYAAQALLGSTIVAGGDCGGRFLDPDRLDHLRATILTQRSGSAVLALRDARGDTAWCALSGARIRYHDQDAVVLIITNVDQLYQTAADLELALDLERRTTEMQRRLMAIAAHDLRTPLAVIDSAAQQIERRADTLEPDQLRARASRIRTSIQRVLSLFDRTLETPEAHRATMGYAPAPGQVEDIAAAVAHQFAEHHPEATITLDLPHLPPVALDPALMEQAFTNLVANAIKYSDGPAHLTISASAGKRWVELIFADRGIGIPSEDRERVFADRARGANVGERPGTGLGLSIVRQIVQLHGGVIDVLDDEVALGQGGTEPPAGTRIRVALPRV